LLFLGDACAARDDFSTSVEFFELRNFRTPSKSPNLNPSASRKANTLIIPLAESPQAHEWFAMMIADLSS